MVPKPEHLGVEVWNGILSVLCLRSFEFRVHFNVSFNLEKYNFVLRRKKTIAFIKIFMNKVQRASWTTNDSYETTLWWVKCKWLRNMQIKFPWKHSRAPRINGGKYLDEVYFRRCAFFFFFHSADFIFFYKTLPRVTSSLVVRMLSGQVIINPGAFWVAQPGNQLCSFSYIVSFSLGYLSFDNNNKKGIKIKTQFRVSAKLLGLVKVHHCSTRR